MKNNKHKYVKIKYVKVKCPACGATRSIDKTNKYTQCPKCKINLDVKHCLGIYWVNLIKDFWIRPITKSK